MTDKNIENMINDDELMNITGGAGHPDGSKGIVKHCPQCGTNVTCIELSGGRYKCLSGHVFQ